MHRIDLFSVTIKYLSIVIASFLYGYYIYSSGHIKYIAILSIIIFLIGSVFFKVSNIIYLSLFILLSAFSYPIMGLAGYRSDDWLVAGSPEVITIFALIIIFLCKPNIRQLTKKLSTHYNFIVLCYVLLMTMSIISASIMNNADGMFMWGGFSYINAICSILLFYVTINCINEKRDLQKLIFVIGGIVIFNFFLLFASKFLPSVMAKLPGSWQVFYDNKLSGMRFHSTFRDYENYSEFLLIMISLFIASMFISKNLIAKLSLLTLAGMSFITFLYAITRGPLIALTASMFIISFFYIKDLNFKIISIFIGYLLSLLAVSFLFQFVDPQYFGLLRERFLDTSFVGGIPDTRIGVWSLAWEYILSNGRYILGHGPARQEFGFIGLSPHSLYLDILMRYGFIALFVILIFFSLLFSRNRKVARILSKNKDPFLIPFAFIELSFFIFIIDQIKVEFTRRANYELIIWIYFGILVAVQNMVFQKYSNRESQQEDSKHNEPSIKQII